MSGLATPRLCARDAKDGCSASPPKNIVPQHFQLGRTEQVPPHFGGVICRGWERVRDARLLFHPSPQLPERRRVRHDTGQEVCNNLRAAADFQAWHPQRLPPLLVAMPQFAQNLIQVLDPGFGTVLRFITASAAGSRSGAGGAAPHRAAGRACARTRGVHHKGRTPRRAVE